MIQFEYESVRLNPKMTNEQFVAYLNDRGREGWEFVTDTFGDTVTSRGLTERAVVFKRKVVSEDERIVQYLISNHYDDTKTTEIRPVPPTAEVPIQGEATRA